MQHSTLLSFLIAFILGFPPQVSALTYNGAELLKKFKKLSSKSNNEYVINDIVDLQNDTILLPLDSKIAFENGSINNGTLIGNSTILNGQNKAIFHNVLIEGTWTVSEISTNMFQDIDQNILRNISALCSENYFNTISIDSDCITLPSNFKLTSNTKLILNADLYTLPTEAKAASCIRISGNNITIHGNNHTLYGSLANINQKECNEWVHGLSIDRNSSNIKVEHLTSMLFCGDGFYCSGSNVEFKDITAKFNGRQGLSITNGKNILVENSTFGYTGHYRMFERGPGAGIDIEPNKGDAVNNIIIQNCRFSNNYRDKRNLSKDIQIFKSAGGKITIKNCSFEGLYLGSCNNINLLHNSKYNIIKLNPDVVINGKRPSTD